jgi:hypothetical protein
MGTEHGHDPHVHDPHRQGSGPINHETTDIELDGVAKLVAGFVVFMALTIAAMYGAFAVYARLVEREHPPVDPMVQTRPDERPRMFDSPNEMIGVVPGGPPLLTNEPVALQEYRADQTQVLTSYGWVDRNNQVVRVPIARAKDLLVERGLPIAAAPEAVPVDETEAGAPDGPEPEAAPQPEDVQTPVGR